MIKGGSLVWTWTDEEGHVRLSKEFMQQDSILQIDALNDWIYELENIRDGLMNKWVDELRDAQKKMMEEKKTQSKLVLVKNED